MATQHKPSRLISLYEKGRITRAELGLKLFTSLDAETAEDCSHSVSPETLAILWDAVRAAPVDDKGWEGWRIFYLGSWVVSGSAEQAAERQRQRDAEERACYRRGVEFFRTYHACLSAPSPVDVDPRWLTSTVVSLAESTYADRAFDRLPILADALQDAGCDDDRILSHCRGPGPHVRGCWVVDRVLGKE